jgi:hypothetical protein
MKSHFQNERGHHSPRETARMALWHGSDKQIAFRHDVAVLGQAMLPAEAIIQA